MHAIVVMDGFNDSEPGVEYIRYNDRVQYGQKHMSDFDLLRIPNISIFINKIKIHSTLNDAIRYLG